MEAKNFAEADALKELETAIERVSEDDPNDQPLLQYTPANGFHWLLIVGLFWASSCRPATP